MYIAKRGETFPSEGKEKTLQSGFSFADCYLMFANYNSGSGHADYSLDNISITDGETTYTEDFEECKDYGESADANPAMSYFEAVRQSDSKQLILSYPYEAGVNKLAFESAAKGDRLMGKTKIETEDKYIGGEQQLHFLSRKTARLRLKKTTKSCLRIRAWIGTPAMPDLRRLRIFLPLYISMT